MEQKEFTFVHLSDIHLNEEDIQKDFGANIRQEVINDVLELEFENITGIIISGDIAFSGKKNEYIKAIEYIKELTNNLKCNAEDVWIVPGNHDVDRNVHKNLILVKDVASELRAKGPDNCDDIFKHKLKDLQYPFMVLKHLDEYNAFAEKFSCPTNSNKLFWDVELELGFDCKLKLIGLNSCIISSEDDNDTDKKLFIGNLQYNFVRRDKYLNILICHHPEDWIIDRDNFLRIVDSHCHLQLYGHKHKQRLISQTNSAGHTTIKLFSGALNPPRNEKDYLPKYNVLNLKISIEGDEIFALIKVYERIWDETISRFKGTLTSGGRLFYEFKLKIGKVNISKLEVSKIEKVIEESMNKADKENSMILFEKELRHKFFSLKLDQYLAIADELKVLKKEDIDLKVNALLNQLYERICQKDLLKELANKITEKTKVEFSNKFPE